MSAPCIQRWLHLVTSALTMQIGPAENVPLLKHYGLCAQFWKCMELNAVLYIDFLYYQVTLQNV